MLKSHDPLFWFAMARDAIAFAIAAGTGIFVWYRTRGARYWPTTYGKVEYGMTSDNEGWRTNLMYSYAVNSEFYSGTHSLKVRNEAAADLQVTRWKGQNVPVRYSPRNPAISVVRMEDQAPLLAAASHGNP